jgi:putative tricarboxylic transport membrane protein
MHGEVSKVRRLDLASGSVLLLVSVVFGVKAWGLGFIGPQGPQPGFFPLLLSGLLCCFSMIIIIRGWRMRPPTRPPRILGEKRDKLFCYVASFSLFGLVLPWIGYTISVAAFFIFLLRFVEKQSWRLCLSIVVSTVIISYLLFAVFLEMPLPEGVLTPVARFILESET